MSVILVTGQPGSGKTALVVDMIAHDEQFAGRPLFVMGIPDLTIDHIPCPPVSEWVENRSSSEDESVSLPYFTFPANALVVIDEAQRIYRPRPVGSRVPPEVAAFETHRHTGVDFILLTQHAGLIDSNIRKLNPRHIHIRVTALGRYKYEWPELGDPDSSSSREIATREKYKLPARSFALYKSSQLHTKIKTKIPWFVYLFAVCAISGAALSYYAYQRVMNKREPVKTQEVMPGHDRREAAAKDGAPATTAEYLASRSPRLAGLYHTAPVYDEITKPVDAPWPSLCVFVNAWRGSPEKCRCLDQQGNTYAMPFAQCKQVALNGIFKEWGAPPSTAAQPLAGDGRPASAVAVASASPPGNI